MPATPEPRSDRAVLSGSRASARGAQEAGARLAIGYPGTPTTLALEYLFEVHPEGMRVEWAVNEKVAFEIAAGHSWAGQRSYVTMKMSGLNVAADAVLAVATSGTVGGLVVYVGDDPGAYYGMVEQDSRLMARLALLPMVEPSNPQEHKELTREAFLVSEASQAPVLVRATTTTAHTCGPVTLETPDTTRRRSVVPFDLDRYTKAGRGRCLTQHTDALARLQKAGRAFERWNLLDLTPSTLGLVASGSVWPYVEECLGARGGVLPNRLRVTVMNPLPDDRIRQVLARSRRVLVLEELEPFLEERVRALASEQSDPPVILGKKDGTTPPVGDFDPDLVARAVGVLYDGAQALESRETPSSSPWASRTLVFCAGCPHRSTYMALKKAIAKAGYDPGDVVVTGDVGCTILGMNEPFSLCRTEVAMGSSISLAQGFAYAGIERPLVATLGDSTFFHAGIPALLNAAAQNVRLTVLVLDNSYAAMTGYQPSLGTEVSSQGAVPNPVSIEELAKAARVRRVRKALPYFQRRLTKVLAQCLAAPGVSVVIAEAPCIACRPRKAVLPYRVNPQRCVGVNACRTSCLESVGCPALEFDNASGKACVDPERCMGCGLCADACGHRAIGREFRVRRHAP